MTSNRSRRRKLLVLSSTFPRWPNDTDPSFVFELCTRLSEAFHIHVLAPHAPGSRRRDRLEGVDVTRYRYFFRRWENLAYQGGILAKLRQKRARAGLIPFFLLGQVLAATRLQRHTGFDALHAHWFFPQGLAAAMAGGVVRNAAPLIVTSHGSDVLALQGKAFDWMRKQIMRRSAAVTVVSDSMRKALRRSMPNSSRIEIISMGVDLENTFVPDENRPGNGRLLFVGRLMKSKGVGVLIRALPEILNVHPAARLQVVGEGPYLERCRQLAVRLGVGERIEFTGAVEKRALPAVYRNASVVVFPSLQAEGFGLVPVEALGCGCAVVASDLPAVREVIRDQKSGLLVPPGDPARMAQAASRLLDDPQLRLKLGQAGRQHVLQRFDWSIVAGRYRTLIETVMG